MFLICLCWQFVNLECTISKDAASQLPQNLSVLPAIGKTTIPVRFVTLTLLTGFGILDVRHRFCTQGPHSYPQLSQRDKEEFV